MKGSLTSWLAEIDPVNSRDSLAVRLFTNPPATYQMKLQTGIITSSSVSVQFSSM